MPSSTLNKRGQTTLPREIRDALKIVPGDKLTMEVREDGAVLIRKKSDVTSVTSAGRPKRGTLRVGLLEGKLKVPADFDAPLPTQLQNEFEAPLNPVQKSRPKRGSR
jgi:AbrB family looped-hinge helix DNA binding protein